MELVVGKFIAGFISLVVFGIFLDGVVCQMNEFVVYVLEVVEFTGSSDVAIFVPVSFDLSINTGKHDIVSNIEFPIVVEKGFVDIRLNNIGLW